MIAALEVIFIIISIFDQNYSILDGSVERKLLNYLRAKRVQLSIPKG